MHRTDRPPTWRYHRNLHAQSNIRPDRGTPVDWNVAKGVLVGDVAVLGPSAFCLLFSALLLRAAAVCVLRKPLATCCDYFLSLSEAPSVSSLPRDPTSRPQHVVG
jgi:hypothetical protein